VKDEMARYLKEHLPEARSRITVVETRRAGRGAVSDIIGMGVLATIAGDLQLKHEVSLMEELLARIAKGTPAAYGRKEVEEAVRMGAVEHLLVSDTLLRDHGSQISWPRPSGPGRRSPFSAPGLTRATSWRAWAASRRSSGSR